MALIFSPGRANLIGEHTDYTGGYVFPFAIPLGNYFFSSPSEGKFEIFSHLYGKDSFSPREIDKTKTWRDYVRGPIFELSKEFPLEPMKVEIFGNLPPGSGLSSSASIELGTLLSICKISGVSLPKKEMALIAKRAENEFVGAPCGIMDQFCISLAREGSLIFLDCETLKYEYVEFPRDYLFLIFYSGKPHSLPSKGYRDLRGKMLKAIRKLGKENSKEISLEEVKRLGGELSKVAGYLVRENERVLRARDSLKSEDFETLSSLLYEAHFDASLSLGVVTPELNLFVSLCRSLGALGARFTGAGFGGSGLAIFPEEKIWEAIERVKRGFIREFKEVPKCWACFPSQGLSDLGRGATLFFLPRSLIQINYKVECDLLSVSRKCLPPQWLNF